MAVNENDYCTLADLKTELGISSSDEDTLLELLIDVASRQVENICRREFAYVEGQEENHSVKSYPRWILDLTPVESITSVEDTEGTTTSTVATTEYEIENAHAGLIWLHSLLPDESYRDAGITQPRALSRARYKVTYNGGYETPNQSGTDAVETLPAPIRYATIRLAAGMYSRQGTDPRVQREHLLEASVWYSDRQFEEEIHGMLRPYRRVVMV